jgi:hypothetical protein
MISQPHPGGQWLYLGAKCWPGGALVEIVLLRAGDKMGHIVFWQVTK